MQEVYAKKATITDRLFLFVVHACGCEFVSFFAGGEFVNELVYVAVHDCGEVVAGISNAMVCDAVLRIVVGADLFGAVAAADL